MHQDRICAGSVYGTARAMSVYMDTMATSLLNSAYQCNDQAMHIHIYYAGVLEGNLRAHGLGGVYLVPNEEALFGSVGTTPMVSYNEWGEILSEKGEVQVAVHQYKTHSLLSDIVWRRYGWLAEVGRMGAVPEIPALVVVEGEDDEKKEDEDEDGAENDNGNEPELRLVRHEEGKEKSLMQYRLTEGKQNTCGSLSSLCSCKYEGCEVHYDWY
jgi:hypothetical protein